MKQNEKGRSIDCPVPDVVAAHLAASFRFAAQSEAAALAKLAVKPAQANSEFLFGVFESKKESISSNIYMMLNMILNMSHSLWDLAPSAARCQRICGGPGPWL